MGRTSRYASRGLDRVVPRVPGRGLFKVVLVIALALGVIGMVSPDADTTEKPRARCEQAQAEPASAKGSTKGAKAEPASAKGNTKGAKAEPASAKGNTKADEDVAEKPRVRCEQAQAEPASAKGNTKADEDVEAEAGFGSAAAGGMPLPGGGAGLWVLLLLLAPLFAYALLGERMLSIFKRDKGDIEGHVEGAQ